MKSLIIIAALIVLASAGWVPKTEWAVVDGMDVWCKNNCVSGNWDNCK